MRPKYVAAEIGSDTGYEVYLKLSSDSTDDLVICLLEEGRNLVKKSIQDTLDTVSAVGPGSHHGQDLKDNFAYLEAFNLLIQYYGGE